MLDDGRLVLGFLDDVRRLPVVVALSQPDGAGDVFGEIASTTSAGELSVIATQIARILSLDHDAQGLAAVGARDPMARALLEAAPGFRPVSFPSPYEAAVWGVLAQRISMPVAAAIKQRLAVATGTITAGWDRELHPSPAPERLLDLRSFAGVSSEKLARLHAVALAALEGKLDAARLRAMPRALAIDELRGIHGVGPWTAEHILLRGCGVVDELPSHEPRLLRGIAELYGLPATPSAEEAGVIAEAWRPYRMWIAVLVVMNLRHTPRWHAARGRPRATRHREVSA